MIAGYLKRVRRGLQWAGGRIRRRFHGVSERMQALPETITRSRKRVVASLAGVDLTLTGGASLDPSLLVQGLDFLADNAVAVIAISLLRNAPSILGLAGTVAYFGLYAYVLYAFLPERLTDLATNRRERRLLMLVAAVGVFGTFVALSFDTVPGYMTLGTPIVAGLSLVGYFWHVDEDPFAGPDGRLYRLSKTKAVDEERAEDGFTTRPGAHGWLPRLARIAGITAIALTLGIFLWLFGTLAFTIGLFFPLPELVVLGWLGLDRLASRSDRVPRMADRSPDVEESIYGVVNAGLGYPLKGIPTGAMILLGVFLSAFPFLLVVSVVVLLSPSNLVTLAGTPGRAFGGFATLGSLVAYSAYGLWYWWRTSRRLPAFLEAHAGEETTTGVTRPVWTTAPLVPVLLTPALGSAFAALYLHARGGGDVWPLWLTVATGVLEFGAILVLIRTYRRTKTTEAQPPASENWALPLGFSIQSAGTLTALAILWSYESIKESGLAGIGWSNPLDVGVASVTTFGMLVVFFYARDFVDSVSDRGGWVGGGLMFSGVLLLVAIASVPMATLYSAPIRYAITGVLVGLGAVLAVMVARD